MNILLIDDESDIRKQIKWHFKGKYRIIEAEDENTAKKILEKEKVNLIILDLFLPPDISSPKCGFTLLNFIKKNYSEIPVVIITGSEQRELGIEAIKKGASDFFQKPINLEELFIVIKRVLHKAELEKEILYLKKNLYQQYDFSNIVYSSEKMNSVINVVKQILDIDLPVLIEGESGTGKELIAKAIYYNSKARNARFVAINCSAIPSNLFESELFGYKKGSFTGAVKNYTGKIEFANNGILFLDEITDMPFELQSKLLRVLEDGIVTPIGSNISKKVKFRLITATNKNIENLVKEGKFREDLFFRINVIRIKLPPLRERKEDIPLLVQHFIKLYNERNNKNIKGISKNLINILINYNYKGNVRELENIIYKGCALCSTDILTEENILLPQLEYENKFSADCIKGNTLQEKVNNFEKMLVLNAIKDNNGVYIKAAKQLGIDKYKMQYLIKKHKIKEK